MMIKETGQMNNSELETSVELVFQTALTQTQNQPNLAHFHQILLQAYQRLHQPMRIAIVGLIKAGKSTLMNALLGESVVATGKVEATFNVNWLKYNQTPSVTIHFKNQRPPETKSFEELQVVTLRAEENQDYLLSIKYIEVGYPNRILQTFNLIDTPGLDSFYKEDSQNTVDFLQLHGQELTKITQTEASNADAVMYLFSQSISTKDKDLMEIFAGSSINQATPINAIGVLTKVDSYWSDYDNPRVGAEKVIKRLSEHPQVKRLFYTISPICGLLALGAQTLTIEEFKILIELAKLPSDLLESKLRVEERFTQREYAEITISPTRRKLVWDRLGQYGVWLACSLINQGINDLESLSPELLKSSGVSQLKELIISHFGHRAFLIKLNSALREINTAYFQERYKLSEKEKELIEVIVGKFEEIEANDLGFSEFKILRDYYDQKLDFDEDETQQLIQITGEYGVEVFHRLGLQNQSTNQEMGNIALKRMQYWQSRATDYLGTDGNSITASSILARSYERILYQIRSRISK
jgi:GTPase SAR1 family protein